MIEYAMTFITLELVYVFIVVYIARRTSADIGRLQEVKHFKYIQIFFILMAVSQIFWMLDYVNMVTFPVAVKWITNFVYIMTFGMSMYEWFRFVAEKTYNILYNRLWNIALKMQTVVSVAYMLIILSSFWTKWIFYIDSNGMYVRGSLFWISILCCYGHWAWAAALILFSRKKSDTLASHQLRKMFLVSLLPVLGGIMQTLFYNIPFTESGMALAILLMFTVLQEDQIKTDALTGLSNRAQLKQAYNRLLNKVENEPFGMFVADINHFKSINDTYGHLVGDKALLLVADGLKAICQKYSSLTVYRYGGDEFVLLVLCKDIPDFDEFSAEVNDFLLAAERNADLGFDVEFSLGYQQITDRTMDIKKAFDAADHMLYENKHRLYTERDEN